MSGRDGFDGDWVEINMTVTPIRDLLFIHINQSPVKGMNTSQTTATTNNSSWDPIWYLNPSINWKAGSQNFAYH